MAGTSVGDKALQEVALGFGIIHRLQSLQPFLQGTKGRSRK